MREHLVRVAGPACFVTFELEAPTRLAWATAGRAEEDRLAAWIMGSPERAEALEAAVRDRDLHGGVARSEAWGRELRGDGGGITAAIEALLGDLGSR